MANAKVGENGLILGKSRPKTREEWIAVMQKNKKRCEELANVIPQTPLEQAMVHNDPARKERYEYAMREIKELEAENIRISKLINKKKYEPYVVAAVNPDWATTIKAMTGEEIKPGDTIYFLNIAAQTRINFSGQEFIVAQSKYFAVSETHLKNAVADFKLYNAAPKKESSPRGNKQVRHSVQIS